MTYKSVDKRNDASLCDDCPARRGEVFVAKIRGSSFRGRLIADGENFSVDNCVFSVGDILVANVQIANKDASAAEQDAEVLTSIFEEQLTRCTTLTTEETGIFCTPINQATDQFMDANYPTQA